MRERDDTRQLCPECEQRLLADLEWFTKNIVYWEADKRDLHYKIRRQRSGVEGNGIVERSL